MIYTISVSKDYREGIAKAKRKHLVFRKMGCTRTYGGGEVWNLREAAQAWIDVLKMEGYEVFGVKADWVKHTRPATWRPGLGQPEPTFRELLRSAKIVILEEGP